MHIMFRFRMAGSHILERLLQATKPDDQNQRIMTIYISNLRTMQKYQAKQYDGATHLFVAETTQGHTQEWERMIGPQLRTYRIPGNHISILEGPGAEVLAQYIRQIDGL